VKSLGRGVYAWSDACAATRDKICDTVVRATTALSTVEAIREVKPRGRCIAVRCECASGKIGKSATGSCRSISQILV